MTSWRFPAIAAAVLAVALFCLFAVTTGTLQGRQPATNDVLRIDGEVAIDAPPAAVWQALTTPAGLAGWIAPESRVELRPGGVYELWFFPDSTDRGMEGTRVLAFIPEELLTHTGEAPETWVVWRLAPADGGTVVRFTGLGTSAEWAARMDYFERVTPDVLDRLKRWVETGIPTRE